MLSYLVAGALMALPATAMPAQVAEPGATDVTLTWDADRPRQFFADWQEPDNTLTRIELVTAGDDDPTWIVDTVIPEDQGNRFAFSAADYGADLIVRVTAITVAGIPIGEPAVSPVFDTDVPPAPVLHTVVPRSDGTVLMGWSPGVRRDDTPNDPLDLPAEDPPRFIPVATVFTFREFHQLSAPTTGTTFVVPPRRLPQVIGVWTLPNEWGPSSITTVEIAGSRLAVVVPKTATDGRPMRVAGTAFEVLRACDPGPCFTAERPDQGRVLQLQSRTGPAAGWAVVATTRSAADGAFRFNLTSPGSRQYRVVAPIVTRPPLELPRGSFTTAPATTSSRPPAARPPAADPPVADPNDDDPDDDGMGGSIPVTGAPATSLAGAGTLFVAFGLLLRWAARRRPDEAG